MLIKNFVKTFTQAQKLTKLLKFNFSAPEFVLHPDIKHTSQINIRAIRRMFLKECVLNHNKTVIWGEPRKLTDRIISLKNQGKCVAVIKRHPSNHTQGGQKQIDIVLPAKQIRGMRKNRNNGLLTVYIRSGGIEYRCILSQIVMHYEEWIQKVVLEEYVPNEANELTIPVEVTHISENPYFIQGSQFDWKKKSIDIICYNDEYPLKFNVDSTFACPDRPYRVGDLANTFPPGVILAPSMNPNDRILEILPIEKMLLHVKQKLMKSYLASSKKEKLVGTQAAGGQAAGGQAAGGQAAGGQAAGGKQASKK